MMDGKMDRETDGQTDRQIDAILIETDRKKSE